MGNCKKEVKINGKKIKNVKEMKFLGITIDHKLTLYKHITNKINSSYHLINFLNELKLKYETPKYKLIIQNYSIIQNPNKI